MSGDDTKDREDQFSALLAAYDESLAAGRNPQLRMELAAPAEIASRLHRAQSCLRNLKRLWPSEDRTKVTDTGAAIAEPPTDIAVTVSDSRQFGRFLIERELGRGGCGIVFLASDPVLHRKVAIKVLQPHAMQKRELSRRFVREARAAAALNHPNIVPVYEWGELGPACYQVQAFCDGPTLASWLQQQREPVSPRVAAQIVATVADAVSYAHDQGILHRDLKPGNVLLEPKDSQAMTKKRRWDDLEFVPMLSDFGMAKLFAQQKTAGDEDTGSGLIIGTPAYMAPEQKDGVVGTVGPQADVYGLGAILYELLTGRMLSSVKKGSKSQERPNATAANRPKAERPDIPSDLDAICQKCLAHDPQQRYQQAYELADDLRRFLGGEPTLVLPWPAWRRGLMWAKRRPVDALVYAVGTVSIIVALGVLYWHFSVTR